MYLWTKTSPLNFGSPPTPDSAGSGQDSPWQRRALSHCSCWRHGDTDEYVPIFWSCHVMSLSSCSIFHRIFGDLICFWKFLLQSLQKSRKILDLCTLNENVSFFANFHSWLQCYRQLSGHQGSSLSKKCCQLTAQENVFTDRKPETRR